MNQRRAAGVEVVLQAEKSKSCESVQGARALDVE